MIPDFSGKFYVFNEENNPTKSHKLIGALCFISMTVIEMIEVRNSRHQKDLLCCPAWTIAAGGHRLVGFQAATQLRCPGRTSNEASTQLLQLKYVEMKMLTSAFLLQTCCECCNELVGTRRMFT